MLPQADGGVVGNDLIVYGTSNLRVVDASALPLQFATHLQTYGSHLADLKTITHTPPIAVLFTLLRRRPLISSRTPNFSLTIITLRWFINRNLFLNKMEFAFFLHMYHSDDLVEPSYVLNESSDYLNAVFIPDSSDSLVIEQR